MISQAEEEGKHHDGDDQDGSSRSSLSVKKEEGGGGGLTSAVQGQDEMGRGKLWDSPQKISEQSIDGTVSVHTSNIKEEGQSGG